MPSTHARSPVRRTSPVAITPAERGLQGPSMSPTDCEGLGTAEVHFVLSIICSTRVEATRVRPAG
jgi:hypothetical protein